MNRQSEIKICGIRSREEIVELKNFSITYFGIILAESSRRVDISVAKEISSAIHDAKKLAVGVFVNEKLKTLLSMAQEISLDVIQLHGQESVVYCHVLKKKLPKAKIWKSFSVQKNLPRQKIQKYYDIVEFPLLDTKSKLLGGSGESFYWAGLKNLIPYSFVLAGGIGAENLEQALLHKPAVVDINSKAETNGKKDFQKVERIMQVAQSFNQNFIHKKNFEKI